MKKRPHGRVIVMLLDGCEQGSGESSLSILTGDNTERVGTSETRREEIPQDCFDATSR